MMAGKVKPIDGLKYFTLVLGAFVSVLPMAVCIITARGSGAKPLTQSKTPEEYAATSVMTLPRNWLNFTNFIEAWKTAKMGLAF